MIISLQLFRRIEASSSFISVRVPQTSSSSESQGESTTPIRFGAFPEAEMAPGEGSADT